MVFPHTSDLVLTIRRAALLASMAASAAQAAETRPFYPPINYAESMPVIKTVAKKEGIVPGQVAPAVDRPGLVPGDTIAVLVSLTKGDDFCQWLVVMTCAELTPAEKQRPLTKPLQLFTSLGTEIVFKEDRAALVVRVLGPYKRVADFNDPAQLRTSVKDAKDITSRILVNADFLRLGFDRACESVLIVREGMKTKPALREFKWNIGTKPFAADVIREARVNADALGLTHERERAFVGAVPALQEFWRLASRTRGLQDIVKDVADLPWWAIIRKGGEVKAKLKPAFSASQRVALNGLRGAQEAAYLFPFVLEINDSPALSCSVMAVDPRPPLLASAGIVSIAAQSPDGKGPYLMVQMWSARLAGSESAAPAADDTK